jgi:flagellar hook-basal body complex protein FliE
MTGIEPIAAITSALSAEFSAPSSGAAAAAKAGGFGDILMSGLRDVDAKVGQADALVQSFAMGKPIPLHQVTLALEQARLSVDLAMEVRARLVETYRDFMTMQV